MTSSFYRRYGKRWFDVSLIVLSCVAMIPVVGITALFVRWKLGAPVFFRQERPGRKGKPFTMYKFRTMKDTRGEDGKLLPDRDRITRLGVILRKTSLDELPELFNVFKGDMSLVGPRPLLMEYLPYYTLVENRRHDVRPGITGLAQVSGRNLVPWDKRLAMDVDYVQQLSFGLDLKILWQTFFHTASAKDVAVIPGAIGRRLSVQRAEKPPSADIPPER